ncbi:single-stranded DNA-binding protein [Streptomyces tateyamensis]|nr:single-stranded DNA-binding protein [Streptomyces tateyamensis]
MPLPTLTGTARLVADPELRITPNGAPVCTIRLAFNSRKQDPNGNWIDGDTFWIRGTAWKQLAENAAETLAKGMEVIVTGELRTESWDKDGQKHQQAALMIRSIGPSLTGATARVTKADRNSQQQRQQPQQQRPQQPQNDPWASDTTQNTSWGTEPPF